MLKNGEMRKLKKFFTSLPFDAVCRVSAGANSHHEFYTRISTVGNTVELHYNRSESDWPYAIGIEIGKRLMVRKWGWEGVWVANPTEVARGLPKPLDVAINPEQHHPKVSVPLRLMARVMRKENIAIRTQMERDAQMLFAGWDL